jgi:hypothetical protein
MEGCVIILLAAFSIYALSDLFGLRDPLTIRLILGGMGTSIIAVVLWLDASRRKLLAHLSQAPGR